jgi:3-hydroxyisobutyrate dehydrogenase-like beta-hydroxyacid dehydrogenase
MPSVAVGLLHPGEMGAAVGSVLRAQGTNVLWASSGRSPATAARARVAELEDVGTTAELARRSGIIVSVCPPHSALDVARSVGGFDGVFVDANAISPATARSVASVIEAGGGRLVDGGIVGPPPDTPGTTRLYLSGDSSEHVAGLFRGSVLEPRIVSDRVGDASAAKMAYAAWTKGTAALVLAVRALARSGGIEDVLLEEWHMSLPDLPRVSARAARSATRKGWRWVAEMDEIAATFAEAELPDGFHRAAAELFARLPRNDDADADDTTLESVLKALTKR